MSKLTDYCSSKYAAVGLHDALTAELKQMNKHGVKTTVICPVFINTGMFRGVSASYGTPLLVLPALITSFLLLERLRLKC